MNKIPIDPVVIVEGKYDKIALDNIIEGTVIPCDGFGIYKNKEQQHALKAMVRDRGAIILTDSDSSGGRLRSFLKTLLQNAEVYLLYIPAVKGKEKRKRIASKEGYLGVEGTDPDILRKLFEEYRSVPLEQKITVADLYEYGFTGGTGSKTRKELLLKAMQLPPHLSNNALLKEINRRFDPEDFGVFVSGILTQK